jgi:hypothetical protein
MDSLWARSENPSDHVDRAPGICRSNSQRELVANDLTEKITTTSTPEHVIMRGSSVRAKARKSTRVA